MHSSTSTTRQTSKSEKINTEEGYDKMFELGYNSDGQLPYYGDIIFKMLLLTNYNEEVMPTGSPAVESVSTTEESKNVDDGFVMIKRIK